MAREATPFWLVWNPDGHAPTVQHGSAEAAQREAERLARTNPGQRFYVLEPVAMIERSDVRITRFDNSEIPF